MALHKEHYPFTNLHGSNHIGMYQISLHFKQQLIHLLTHSDHCLEIIRQSIQCFGSTTLIPTKFMHGVQHQYIDSDQVHVCRSFPYLRDWVTSRKKGNDGYVERNIALVDPEMHRQAQMDEESDLLDATEAFRHSTIYDT